MLTGSITRKGKCTGGDYTHPMDGLWYKDGFLVAEYIWTTVVSTARVNKKTGEVSIRGSLSGKVMTGSLYVDLLGKTIWDVPEEVCKNEFVGLYTGEIEIVGDADSSNFPRVFWVKNPPGEQKNFYIHGSILGHMSLCGEPVYATSYHNIFVSQRAHFTKLSIKQVSSSVKLSTYFNAKLTSAVRDLESLIEESYLNTLSQVCELSRKLLATQLEMVRHHPNSVSLLMGNQDGIFARAAGEVIHLVKCLPRTVRLRAVSSCHEGLPVLYKNQSMFLQPNTRILTNDSAEVMCSKFTPVMFRHTTGWIALSKHGYIEKQEPDILEPNVQVEMKFRVAISLEHGGIYNQEGLDAKEDFIMFSSSRETVEVSLVRGLTGTRSEGGRYDFGQVMTDGFY